LAIGQLRLALRRGDADVSVLDRDLHGGWRSFYVKPRSEHFDDHVAGIHAEHSIRQVDHVESGAAGAQLHDDATRDRGVLERRIPAGEGRRRPIGEVNHLVIRRGDAGTLVFTGRGCHGSFAQALSRRYTSKRDHEHHESAARAPS
jgi:hypothetical protein